MDSARTDEWDTRHLDLDAYLARLGVPAGSPVPATGATLHQLHRQHVATIPFENIDVLLERPISTDIDAVQAKLVTAGRGGYCHEHGILFGAVLQRLGFHVDRLLARPGDRRDRPSPTSHLSLHVRGLDGEWLADVGFGAGLLEPVAFSDPRWHTQGDWAFTLAPAGETRCLLERVGDEETDLYTFVDQPCHPSDVMVANHYTATHPHSPFTGQLVAMQRNEHELLKLQNRQVVRLDANGTSTSRELDDRGVIEVLSNELNLQLSSTDIEELLSRLPHPG